MLRVEQSAQVQHHFETLAAPGTAAEVGGYLLGGFGNKMTLQVLKEWNAMTDAHLASLRYCCSRPLRLNRFRIWSTPLSIRLRKVE
jgi:hypothetical protein